MHERERRAERLRTALVVVLAVATVAFAGWVITHPKSAPTPTAATARPDVPAPEDTMPAALWVGDSYTAGAGSGSKAGSESCLTSTELGWICNLDAQGSTGFLAGKTASGYLSLSERVEATHQQMLADVVVVDAGRNDAPYPLRRVKAAAAAYFAEVHQLWPDARLVFIAPYLAVSDDPPLGETWVPFLRAQAKKYDAVVVDPLGEGWMSVEKMAGMVVPENQRDARHPDARGHRYIANHLAEALREKLGQVSITDLRGARS